MCIVNNHSILIQTCRKENHGAVYVSSYVLPDSILHKCMTACYEFKVQIPLQQSRLSFFPVILLDNLIDFRLTILCESSSFLSILSSNALNAMSTLCPSLALVWK